MRSLFWCQAPLARVGRLNPPPILAVLTQPASSRPSQYRHDAHRVPRGKRSIRSARVEASKLVAQRSSFGAAFAWHPACVTTPMAENEQLTRRTRPAHTVIGEKVPARGVAHWFTRTSSAIATLMGSPWAFIVAAGVVLLWAVTGPIFDFSTDWSLAINTITTIITFLMVFVIQNTQNRDAKAMHLKLDELLRAVPRARKEFMEAEEEDLDEIEREKEIVDKADPAPPAHKKEERPRDRHAMSGNGKTNRA